MKITRSYKGPIHLLRLSTSDFVWDWYEESFKKSVLIYTKGEVNSEYNSFMITFKNYRDGNTKGVKMLKINPFLKRIVEAVFPIKNSDIFFIGDEEEMEKEALETAKRMIQAFEIEFEKQKKCIAI